MAQSSDHGSTIDPGETAQSLTPAAVLRLVRESRADGFRARIAPGGAFSPRAPQTLAPRPQAPVPPPVPAAAPITTPTPVIAPQPDLAQIRAEAHARGLAEGEARARTEARREAEAALAGERAQLADTGAQLSALIARLAEPASVDLAALAPALESAVCALAAERAGQAIDSLPQSFLRRIARLAERLTLTADGLTLRLHPDDLRAVEPFVATAEGLSQARLVADPALMRGDVSIRAGGVRIDDCLSEAP